MLRLFALYENLVRFVLPLCSAIPDRPQPETPVSLSNNIVDISGVSLKQFWNLKGHMQDASQLATAHYPETLDRIFVRILLILLPQTRSRLTRSPDYWSAVILSDGLELDKALVRSNDCLEDLHTHAV